MCTSPYFLLPNFYERRTMKTVKDVIELIQRSEEIKADPKDTLSLVKLYLEEIHAESCQSENLLQEYLKYSPSERIRFRKSKGMSQVVLAKKLGVSQTSVSNWERG